MKFIPVIPVLLLCLNPLLSNNNIADTSNLNGFTGNDVYEDTSLLKSDTSSVQNNLNAILYQLHSMMLEQQYSIKKYRAIVIGMILLISFLLIIIILFIKRHFYFPNFPFFRQKKGYHAGLVCLQMISKYFGNRISYRKIRKVAEVSESQEVLSLDDIADIADKTGLQIGVIKTDVRQLMSDIYLPVILYFQNHMAILHKITNEFIYLADPFYGFLKLKIYYFLSAWYAYDNNKKGIALLIRPLKFSKGKIKRVNKALSIDFSRIKLLDKKYWKEFKCDISNEGGI